MFDSIKSVFAKKEKKTLIEQSDLTFSHRLLTNGLWLEGENKEGQQSYTQQCIFEYLLRHEYPVIYICTEAGRFNEQIEATVTEARQSRRYRYVGGSIGALNELDLKKALQNKKIVHIDLTRFEQGDKKVALERVNHQLKLLFHDMYVNFKAYEKREGLRGVLFIDKYDIKDFKVFASMEFFDTMRDFEIGYVFTVEENFLTAKVNAHKQNLKEIRHFTFLQA